MARVLERPERAGKWSRVITDRQGQLYFLNDSDPAHPGLEQSDPEAPPIPDPGFVRDLFDKPAIQMDEQKKFFLPNSLARICHRAPAAPLECHPRPKAPSIIQTAQDQWLIYVVRRAERRVDAYLSGARLRHSWGAGMDWLPTDVAACGDMAFIVDELKQLVYRHRSGSENLKALDLGNTSSRHWSRVACDRDALYLYTPGAAMVQVFGCSGAPRGERCYADVAGLFEGQRPPEPAPPAGSYFDSAGHAVQMDLSEATASPLFKFSGFWQSQPFDSKVYRCQWHRIELSLSEFPPGSRVSVATCATEKPEDVYDPSRSQFVDAATIVAPINQDPCSKSGPIDCLVQSGQGQYLTVRVKLEGDGFITPAVDSARIHYPRDSYLAYLPATYSVDDESRIFLERFLSIFQTEWDELERTIDESERYFDPDAVPEGPFMDYLAQQWLALSLEGDWSAAQKRRLLSAIPKIYPQRGQLGGLRDLVSVYLANMAGVETADVRSMDFPVIVEGFREREYLFASAGEASALGHGASLWSASVKRRLQLGVYSTEGEAELVSVGDPVHDMFNQYAHRFHIYVPAAWVRDASAEIMLRRALNAEKPAHTQYDLCLVEARFRVEAQSTIGLDTIIGEVPVFGLGCVACSSRAPSLPPTSRLGYDTVLAGLRPDPSTISESGYGDVKIRRMQ
jgi:phage tail-like protein